MAKITASDAARASAVSKDFRRALVEAMKLELATRAKEKRKSENFNETARD